MKNLVIIIFLFFGACQTRKIKPTELVWGYSGWGVGPEKIQNPISLSKEEKLEYFYIVGGGKALPRAIEVDSHSFMESTCKLSALKENQEALFLKAVQSADSKAAKNTALLEKSKEIFKESFPKVAYCRPTGTNDKYTTCDCVIYIFFEGGKEALTKALSNLK